MKTTIRILSIILTLALLAGCGPAATPVPTATNTPAPTATLTPTLEPTATPTATPEPLPQGMPGPEDPYPASTLTRTTLTTADMDAQKTAFADLTKAEPYVALEAKALENKLNQIDADITTYGVVHESRWGVFAQKKDGTALILRKTTDGGKTWVNVIDVSAYSELVALQSFDPDNYRFVPLNRPSGIPKDATTGVIAENNWMVYVFRDTEGSIIAWYDAANDVFKTAQGDELKIQEVSYIPYEAGQTWEQVQKNNVVHWPLDNPEQFEKELKAMHELDIQLEPQVDLFTYSEAAANYHQYTGLPDWLWFGCRTYSRTTRPNVSVVATLQNPNGDEMVIVMSQLSVKLANGENRAFSIPTVRNSTFIKNGTKRYFDEKSKEYTRATSEYYVGNSLLYYDLVTIKSIISKKPLNTTNLPQDQQMIARLYNYNTEIGVTQAFERLINGEGTDEDIALIQSSGIIPVTETHFEDDTGIEPIIVTP